MKSNYINLRNANFFQVNEPPIFIFLIRALAVSELLNLKNRDSGRFVAIYDIFTQSTPNISELINNSDAHRKRGGGKGSGPLPEIFFFITFFNQVFQMI